MDVATALKKPFTDIKKLIIGTVLGIIPVVNFFTMGFALECSGLGKNKKSATMPEWDDWGDYFVKGLLAFVVSILYALPGGLVILFGLGGAFFSMMGKGLFTGMMSGNMTGLFSTLATFGPVIFVGGLLLLLGAYLSPAGILSYLQSRDFGKAFAFGTIFAKAFSGAYFAAWIVGLLMSLVIAIVLGMIPIVGGMIGLFVVSVFYYTLLGEAYASLK